MISVVIAAHNEAAVIGRCLGSLAECAERGELDVTVVANGCSDDTVDRASAFTWARVVELVEPGKARALNAGDAVAEGFPRVYLDADIVMTGAELERICSVFEREPSVLAAVPARRLGLSGRPVLVRAYFAIQKHLPAFTTGLLGRGGIALYEQGRGRVVSVPALVADDLYLDSIFTSDQKRQVRDVFSTVQTPLRTADLVNRLVRVRRGNADLRAAAGRDGIRLRVRPADRTSWLRDVVLRRPWLLPAAACYVAITLYAAQRSKSAAGRKPEWLRDESSRRAALPGGADR